MLSIIYLETSCFFLNNLYNSLSTKVFVATIVITYTALGTTIIATSTPTLSKAARLGSSNAAWSASFMASSKATHMQTAATMILRFCMQKSKLTFQYPLYMTSAAVAMRLAQAAPATAIGMPRYPNIEIRLYTSIIFMQSDNRDSMSTLRDF